MYDREDLKMKLEAYSEREYSKITGFVSILRKSLKKRLKDNDINKIPPLVDENLQDIVVKNIGMTTVDIEKICDEYDVYFNKLVNVINFANDRHKVVIDEIKEERKSRTFSKVSKIISRVSVSRVMYNPTYHNWKWFDTTTEDINEILKDKTLSEYEFDVEFISTDTMSIAE